MPIVEMKDMLKHARVNNYAVASFTVTSLDILAAVIEAAEDKRSPVILIIPYNKTDDSALDLLMPSVEAAAQNTSVPVVIQARCNPDLPSAIDSINAGCNALLIDSSDLNYVNKITHMAHDCGITVEGRLNGGPDIAKTIVYAEKTNIDLLNFSTEPTSDRSFTNVEVTSSILNELQHCQRAALALNVIGNINEAHCQHYISHGAAKINFDRLLSDAIEMHLRIIQEEAFTAYSRLIQGIHAIVHSEASACIELCQSAGQAESVLQHCEEWLPVEHVIIFNVSGIDDQQAQDMMAEGKASLSTIPGVRNVITASAVKEDAKYRFSWLIRFCHPAVIDSYRDHPTHVDFADRLFRPVAGDRISIDYQWLPDQAQHQRAAIYIPAIGAETVKPAPMVTDKCL